MHGVRFGIGGANVELCGTGELKRGHESCVERGQLRRVAVGRASGDTLPGARECGETMQDAAAKSSGAAREWNPVDGVEVTRQNGKVEASTGIKLPSF